MSNVPNVTVNLPKALLATPSFFDGSEEKYLAWKQQVQIFVISNEDHYKSDTARQMTALSYMREKKALRWATSIITDIIARSLATPSTYTRTWAEFWAAADTVFNPPNSENDAAYKLEDLKQGTLSAEEYFIEFDLLATQANLTATHFDTYKIRLADRKLNRALQQNVYNTSTRPTTWATYKTRATALDNNWRIGVQARASDPRPTPRPQQPQQQQQPNNSSWKTQPPPGAQWYQNRPGRDPNAMDTSAAIHVAASATQQATPRPEYSGNKTSPAVAPGTRIEGDRAALMAAGACFYCKSTGHIKSACPVLAAKNTRGTYTPVTRPPGSMTRSADVTIPESPAPPYAPSVASSRDMDVRTDFPVGRE